MDYLMHHSVFIYDLTTFLILGQKFVKKIVGFLENSKKSKRHSEINRPLGASKGRNGLSSL